MERVLYEAGDVFYACATPPGSRTAMWKSLGAVGIMEARRRRQRFAADLRHTFASSLIDQGHDIVFVSRQLGHAKPSITLKVYAHLFDAERHADRARTQLEAEYGGLIARRR